MLVPPPVPVTWPESRVSHGFSRASSSRRGLQEGWSYPAEGVELCAERANVVRGVVRVFGVHECLHILSRGGHFGLIWCCCLGSQNFTSK
jgi:hypothetical protein